MYKSHPLERYGALNQNCLVVTSRVTQDDEEDCVVCGAEAEHPGAYGEETMEQVPVEPFSIDPDFDYDNVELEHNKTMDVNISKVF